MILPEPICLHLISWNRPKMTELVVKAIHCNTQRGSFKLIVLDNGSNEKTVEMLQDLRDDGLIDELVPLKTNLGLEAARQLLLREFTNSKYFVCVDNDCLPEPISTPPLADWLERLVELMERHEDYSAIALRTQVMIGSGDPFAGHEHEDVLDFPHPGGSFRLMRTGDVMAVGGWRGGTKGRGQEERYICSKLRAEGWKTGFATKIQCLHLFGDRQQTKERWGYDESLRPEDTGHSDIFHPALEQGDQKEEVVKFAGERLAKEYFTW